MGIAITNLPSASVVNSADLLVIVQDGTTKKVAASLVGTGGGGGGGSTTATVKVVDTNTYTFLQDDSSKTLVFTHPSGAILTVPHGLLSGTEAMVYALSGTVQFATASAGIAGARIPLGISASTTEAMSIAGFQISEITSSYILGGDLRYIGPDPLTDSDFGSNGRMIRTGIGNYNVILDQLSASSNPFTGSDYNSGYRVGSIWINQAARSAFMCVDDTPATASWKNLNQVSEIERDMYIGSARYGALIFRDDFTTDTDLWSSTLAGAGSSVGNSATGPSYGYCYISPGTTNTGSAAIRTAINLLYSAYPGGGYRMVSQEVIAGVVETPPNPTNDYIVRYCGFYDSTLATAGISFLGTSGNYGVDNYWKIVSYVGGVSSSFNTDVLYLTGYATGNRFRIDWNQQFGTASFYINDALKGILTGSQISAPSAGYYAPVIVNKITGTTARRVALDFAQCYGYFSGNRR